MNSEQSSARHVRTSRLFDRSRAQFEQESYAPYLAMRLFERVEREHPAYPGLDKAIYSRGLAWKQLMDFWPFDAYGAAPPGVTKEQRIDGAVRSLVTTFEHLAATYPDSTLTDDALAAIAYWRRERPKAFGRRSARGAKGPSRRYPDSTAPCPTESPCPLASFPSCSCCSPWPLAPCPRPTPPPSTPRSARRAPSTSAPARPCARRPTRWAGRCASCRRARAS